MSTEENDLIQPDESQVNITDLLLAYLANWKWFLLSVFLCMVGAYFYIATKIPLYKIDASIYLSEDNSTSNNVFNIDNTMNPMVPFKNYIDETELEVLKSRNNLVRIVDSLGLAYSYYAKGELRNRSLYQNNTIVASMDPAALNEIKSAITIIVNPDGDNKYNIEASTMFNSVKEERKLEQISLPYELNLSYGTVTLSKSPVADDKEGGPEIIIIRNPRVVARELSSSFNIEFAKNSEKIMRISFLTDDVKKGDDILYALLHFYNADIIEDKNKSAVQTEAFILDRLVMINNELKDVESRLQAYRQDHNVTDLQAQQTLNLSLQSDYAKESAEVEAEMAIYDEIQRIVSTSGSYQTLPAAVNDPTIVRIIEDYNRKIGQLNRTLEGSTANNPLVITMQEELGRDKVRILQNLASARRNLSTKRTSIRQLESRSTGQLASAPKIDKGFQEIFREQQVKVNIYTFLLQRREEIALQKTLATNTARLIDNPEASAGPVAPRKLSVYAFALVLALLIPAVIIYLRRMLFPVFSDKEELKRYTRIPVIGEICDLKEGTPEDEIVIKENSSSPEAELFRLLRNNISFTRCGKDSKVILVTSTVSGEGKTFIAANLAMTYALMGKKVLVVGLDLRRPMLAHRFGYNNKYGVTTYITGQNQDLNQLVLPTKESPNLFVLPAGPLPPNPNELLMSANMTLLMDNLRKMYDYVILDTAPVGIVSDTFLIVRQSDLQLYVTRANFSSKKNLKILQEAISTGKFQSAYIVLNGVEMSSNSYVYRRYGKYGSYGSKNGSYGYGYGSKKESEK